MGAIVFFQAGHTVHTAHKTRNRGNSHPRTKEKRIKKILLENIKDQKMHPGSIKLSLIDVFKQGVIECHQLRNSFLRTITKTKT